MEEGFNYHKKCSREFFGTPKPPSIEYSLDQMDELAKKVVERSVTVPGVQAKLSMSLVKKVKEKSDTRLTVIGALGGEYILKPPSGRFPEMPANEHLSMRMAEAFGIRVVPSSLIRLTSGELAYITKRIDRSEDGEKIHMIDMFQITEAFDKYKGSLEKVGKALDRYSDNTLLDKVLFFELVIFCYITGNNDMHLKNFSMVESSSGWVLAPAYDLLNASIINTDDEEELALTMAGRKKKVEKLDFTQFGKELGLTDKQINGAYNRFEKNIPGAMEFMKHSFLSKEMITAYKDLLSDRLNKLEINFKP